MAAGSWLLRLGEDEVGADDTLTDAAEVLHAACNPITVTAASADLGLGPTAWAVRVARRIIDEITRTVSGYGPEYRLILLRSAESILFLALRGLKWGLESSPGVIPVEALEAARHSVRQGVPLDQVLRHHRLGHAIMSLEMMQAIGRHTPAETAAAEIHWVNSMLFQYSDVLASTVAEAYLAEREVWRGSGAALRRGLVERVVAGSSIGDEHTATETLGYRLRQHHLAFILWSDLRDDEPRSQEALHALATGLTKAARAAGSLIVPVERTVLWGWMGWASPPPADVAEPLRAELAAHPGIRLAIGPVSADISGMRRSHLCARQAVRVGRIGGSGRLCDYADIRLVAMLTADEEQARWFVEDTLGDLAADDERTRELRETLRAYLAAERSLVAAAEQLHVARNTVTYRVKRAEERLGRPTTENRLDVMLALEVACTLEDGALDGKPPGTGGATPRPSANRTWLRPSWRD